MITDIIKYSGKSFVRLDYSDFIIDFDGLGLNKHTLRESANDYDIYGYSLGSLTNRPVIMIDAQIHKHHEWRSAYWLKHFVETLIDPEQNYPDQKENINYLKSKYSFYFIPVVSPDNYNKPGGIGEGNGNNVDIAHNFDYKWDETPEGTDIRGKGGYPFSETESKNIKNVVEQYKPCAYINCHSWGDFTGYTLRHPANTKHDDFIVDVYNNIFDIFDITGNTQAKIGDVLPYSSSYNWTGTKKDMRNEHILSTVFEVGTEQSTTKQSSIGVTGLLTYCLLADEYRENKMMKKDVYNIFNEIVMI